MIARYFLFLVCVAVAGGQSSLPAASPEIRGTVLDPDTKQPIAFAETSLYFIGEEQPRIMTGLGMMKASETAMTGLSGEFTFHLDKLGYYAVATKREGFNAPGGNNSGMSNSKRITLTKEAPVQEVRLYLSKPGQITGIVTDETTHEPLANVRLLARRPKVGGGMLFTMGGAGSNGVSGKDGKFTIGNLPAGQYVVEVNRQKGGEERLKSKFTDEDLKAVERDLEQSVWPGGHDESMAVPVTLSSGGSTDVGVLRVRKVPYYRLHVKLPNSPCGPDDTMMVSEQVPGSMMTIAQNAGCRQDFLLTGFPPGAYQLLLVVNKRSAATREMAAIPFVIEDKNIDVAADLARGLTVDVRFVAADGAKAPDWTTVSIMAYAWDMVPMADFSSPVKAGADGKARLVGLPLGRLDLTVSGIDAGHDVTEMRYNGSALVGNRLKLEPNAATQSLTIVVDDKPATISGTVTKGDEKASKPFVVLLKLPLPPEQSFGRFPTTTGDDKGQFQFAGLAPGKYYLVAVASPDSIDLRSTVAVQAALAKAVEVEVSPGNSKSVQLELMDRR